MAYYCSNSLFVYYFPYISFRFRTNFCVCQAAQLAHILAGRTKDLAEEVDREKGARESAAKTAKEKLKAAESAEKKAATAEKNRALAEKRCSELLAKKNETDVKLAEAISLNTSQVEELTDLRAALEACKQKWYNEGFADAEKSAEPVVVQARRLGFEAGWFAALQALGVPEDSPLRDPGQIPFLSLVTAVQDPTVPAEKEETASMRELVEQINAHAEPDEMEATNIPTVQDLLGEDLHFPVTDQRQHEVTDPTRPST